MKAIPLLLLLWPSVTCAQLSETFSDGNFTNAPAWYGDTAFWHIVDGKLNGHFTANNSIATYFFQLSTKSERVENTVWEFWVKTGPTSRNNFIRIFLCSQDSLLRYDRPNRGYFVEIGNTPDNVCLYKKDSLQYSQLIRGREDITDHAELKIKVTCDNRHQWHLYTDVSGTGYVSEGTATDRRIKQGRFFNIVVFQRGKSANHTQWLDDISIRPYTSDTIPPILTKIIVKDSHSLELLFSEPLAAGVLTKSDYSINDHHPDTVRFPTGDSSAVLLSFKTGFQPNANTLHIKNVSDVSGNKTDTTVQFYYFIPASFDVVINEIYADPTPSQGLPEAEYIELLNVSSHPVDLNGWQVCDRTKCVTIPTVALLPDSLLLLCNAADTMTFSAYGKVVGISRFISLNNGGDDLILKNATGEIIHSVHYTKESYQDAEKAKGGWSLELQNPDHPCLTEGNWAASNAETGGSPGKANTIKENQNPTLHLRYVEVTDSIHLVAAFNADIDAALVSDAVFTINGQRIISVEQDKENPSELKIQLSNPLKKKIIYTFQVQGLKSCGLTLAMPDEMQFGLPEAAAPQDVVINEILFNPRDGSEDFVELYNTSNKIIDLQTLFFADMDNGMIDKLYPASATPYYLLPGSYVAITTNKKDLLQQYICKSPKTLVEVEKLPSYPNKSGTVVLTGGNKKTMDKMQYNEDDHSPFFHNEEGVSLERINPFGPSSNKNNWASASANSGYATPGYRNSQFVANQPAANIWKISPEVFSPDGDGMDDLTYINYTLPSGYAATIEIFNEYGRPVRHLITNSTLSTEGKIPWNGKDDNGRLLPTGIYIFYIGLYHPSGAVHTYKLPVVLVKKR